VPCCGTFPELAVLTAHFPDREIVGIDLSAGMVERARAAAARHPRATVVQGDASTLDAGRYAAVVSVFGLQQLPEPDRAIGAWTAALRPGGWLSVVFWPEVAELDGPFARLDALVRRRTGTPVRNAWEPRLGPAVTARGAVIERDQLVAFPMSHPDAATFFDTQVRSGPLRPLANARGEAFIDELRQDFLQQSPAGEWQHAPEARHIVAMSAAANGVVRAPAHRRPRHP